MRRRRGKSGMTGALARRGISMKTLNEILNKHTLKVIGLMSGTSADGMDAALTEISGSGTDISVRQLAFVSIPYMDEERREILRLASGGEGGSHDLALFSFYLGGVCLRACREVCAKAEVLPEEIDLVGSHGQTLWHIPQPESYLGTPLTATLQLGEPSVIAEGMGCPVVSDFRVRDMAAGGQGAPLVPYAEYLLYRRADKTVGLQNIGGIGNLSVIPAGCGLEDVFAFDTGPGNMVMDRLTEKLTGGSQRIDTDGRLAAAGKVSSELLAFLMEDAYLKTPPPKTTGREKYGDAYIGAVLNKAAGLGLPACDIIATATDFTAACIQTAIRDFCRPMPEQLIVGGGGSRNPTLMAFIRRRLSIPVLTNEDLGFDSDAKEAVAFAVMAAECVRGVCNNVPRVTGARHPVVMGKITV